MESMSTPR